VSNQTCVEILPAAPGLRNNILSKLRAVVADGQPIIGGGVGIEIIAKFEEEGSKDLIFVYNSGMFRMGGHCSLAGLMSYKDANAIMLKMDEII